MDYWDKLLDDFCVPTAVIRLCLINQETKQWQKFDLERSLIKHFLYGLYVHNLRIMRGLFTEMQEFSCDPMRPPPPPVWSYLPHIPEPLLLGLTTHIVESEQMMNLIAYENGWQCQMKGKLRALLTPYTTLEHVPDPANPHGPKIPQYTTSLRLQYLSFFILAHELYMPFEELNQRLSSSVIPSSLVEQIIEYGLKREKERELEQNREQEREKDSQGSETPRASSEHVRPKNTSTSSRSRTMSPTTSSSDANSDQHMPKFKLPRPRISTLRFIDEYGVPNASIPVLNVCVPYSP